jgi:hypothetical protein
MSEAHETVKAAKEIEKILAELTEESIAQMSEEEVMKYRKELNVYGRTIEGSNKYLTFSFTNLTEKYQQKLLLTGMIGFLNRMVDEWHVPDGLPVIPVYDYVEDPESLEKFHADWKKTEKIQKEIDENRAWMAKRVVVKEFLEEMFQFNPDKHVRSSYRPQPKDLDRKIIDTPAANLAIEKLKAADLKFREQMVEFDRVQKLRNMAEGSELKNESLDKLVAKKLVLPGHHYSTMNFESWSPEDKNLLSETAGMIPPDDVFHRYRTYIESNYDKLREAVQYLYCDKPDFDIAINPYNWHGSLEDAQEFQKKHKNEVISDIIVAHSGKWNFFAPFEHVRDSVKYFNDNTIILEEIAIQQEKDAKLGQDLMRRRVAAKKRQNIEEEGPDSEFFKKWKDQNTTLKDMGAETLNKESYASLECPDDAIEVPVWKIAQNGKMEKKSFYSRAEAPQPFQLEEKA